MANKQRNRKAKRVTRERPRRDFYRATIRFSEQQYERLAHLMTLRTEIIGGQDELAALFVDSGMRDVERQIRDLEQLKAVRQNEPALAGAGA